MRSAFHGLIRAVLRHSDEDDRKIALGYFSYLMSADNTDALAPSVDLVSKSSARRAELVLIMF